MIVGQSHWELLLIRASIFLFSYLGLGCLIYFILAAAIRGARGITYPFSIFVESVGVIEILWYFAFFIPRKARLQKSETRYDPAPLTRAQRKALFHKGLNLIPDLEYYIRKWLRNAHWEDIRRDNIKEWLLWALFEREGPPMEDDAELEEYLLELEVELGMQIKKGTGESKPLLLSFDPVKMTHRSLFYYTIIGFLDTITTIFLLIMGFKFYRQQRNTFLKTFPFRPMTLLSPNQSASTNLSYFYRPHKSTTARPILFCHGVGIGLFPYLYWLNSIPKDVGIIAIELLPISSRITGQMPSTPELTLAVLSILAQQAPAFDDFVFVGHSYGTFLAAPLLQRPDIAPKINSVVLCDPVSLLLHLPDVAYNFAARKPRRANEWQIWWYAATDPGIAHTLGRRLCWREVILWKEALQNEVVGRRATTIVGGRDNIINPKAVASYVYFGDMNYTIRDVEEWKTTTNRWTGTGELELVWLPELDHGQAFLSKSQMPILSRVVQRYCKKDVGDAESAMTDKEDV